MNEQQILGPTAGWRDRKEKEKKLQPRAPKTFTPMAIASLEDTRVDTRPAFDPSTWGSSLSMWFLIRVDDENILHEVEVRYLIPIPTGKSSWYPRWPILEARGRGATPAKDSKKHHSRKSPEHQTAWTSFHNPLYPPKWQDCTSAPVGKALGPLGLTTLWHASYSREILTLDCPKAFQEIKHWHDRIARQILSSRVQYFQRHINVLAHGHGTSEEFFFIRLVTEYRFQLPIIAIWPSKKSDCPCIQVSAFLNTMEPKVYHCSYILNAKRQFRSDHLSTLMMKSWLSKTVIYIQLWYLVRSFDALKAAP